VNKEVLNYNTQLGKVTRLQPNVKLLEIKLVRNHFTRHGLHLNLKGKKLISQEIAMIVDQFFKQTKKSPIPTPRKSISSEQSNSKIQKPNTVDKVTNIDHLPHHQSTSVLSNSVTQNPDTVDEITNIDHLPQHQGTSVLSNSVIQNPGTDNEVTNIDYLP
jgi:hypothetical protein